MARVASSKPRQNAPLELPLAATAVLPYPGERVLLRRLEAGDLDAFTAYRSDPEVAALQGWAPMDHAAAAAFIDSMAQHAWGEGDTWLQLAIARRADDTLIGDIGIHFPANPYGTAEWGVTLAPAARGAGLATEAVALAIDLIFTVTPAAAVRAVADVRNAASLALFRRLGMRLATRRRSLFKGEPADEEIHRLSRSKWVGRAPHARTQGAA